MLSRKYWSQGRSSEGVHRIMMFPLKYKTWSLLIDRSILVLKTDLQMKNCPRGSFVKDQTCQSQPGGCIHCSWSRNSSPYKTFWHVFWLVNLRGLVEKSSSKTLNYFSSIEVQHVAPSSKCLTGHLTIMTCQQKFTFELPVFAPALNDCSPVAACMDAAACT